MHARVLPRRVPEDPEPGLENATLLFILLLRLYILGSSPRPRSAPGLLLGNGAEVVVGTVLVGDRDPSSGGGCGGCRDCSGGGGEGSVGVGNDVSCL